MFHKSTNFKVADKSESRSKRETSEETPEDQSPKKLNEKRPAPTADEIPLEEDFFGDSYFEKMKRRRIRRSKVDHSENFPSDTYVENFVVLDNLSKYVRPIKNSDRVDTKELSYIIAKTEQNETKDFDVSDTVFGPENVYPDDIIQRRIEKLTVKTEKIMNENAEMRKTQLDALPINPFLEKMLFRSDGNTICGSAVGFKRSFHSDVVRHNIKYYDLPEIVLWNFFPFDHIFHSSVESSAQELAPSLIGELISNEVTCRKTDLMEKFHKIAGRKRQGE
ncbi:unnamed protein product [Caenorhabditis auriculariae]|uniref:Uncharacterized protein n=1 Tax=Caenorhabditis auriculariae TaxID=2777116 RepID=A0A8S1GXX4_9PELO|nr:unnamed protein product [Caenorhabditis auriculariae]